MPSSVKIKETFWKMIHLTGTVACFWPALGLGCLSGHLRFWGSAGSSNISSCSRSERSQITASSNRTPGKISKWFISLYLEWLIPASSIPLTLCVHMLVCMCVCVIGSCRNFSILKKEIFIILTFYKGFKKNYVHYIPHRKSFLMVLVTFFLLQSFGYSDLKNMKVSG